ncbi:MAG: ComEC/Rec2 family competence protein [Maribacter sp.]
MKLLAFISIKLTLLLILGILIGRFFPIDKGYLLLSTVLLFFVLALLFLTKRKPKWMLFECTAALIVISLGIFVYTDAQPIHDVNHYSKINSKQPALLNLKIKEVLKPNPFSQRFLAKILHVDGHQTSGTVLISVPTDSISHFLEIDDELWSYAQLQPLRPPSNPHQFDYRKYLADLGVYDQIRIEKADFVKTKNSSKTLFGIAAGARNHIISKLRSADFGDDELGVIQALLLGQRADISEETYTNYQKAGAVHILALSGLHIGILLIMIQFLLSPLKQMVYGKTLILVLSVVLIWGFAFLAGLSASIIRATTMFTFVAYALYLNRPSNSFNILALSVVFILLFINPNLLFQVGFQMSYAAVFAILGIYPLLQKLWFPKNRVVRYFWQLLAVSIAAQLGVLPISLYYFHQFPGLFFISNLIIIPALGIILGMGVIVIALAVTNWLPPQLVWLYNGIIHKMNLVIQWVAQQEHFILKNVSFDFVQLILCFLVILLFINLSTRFTYRRILFLFVGLFCFQGWTIYQTINAKMKKEVVVLHQTKNNIILNRSGTALSVFSHNQSNAERVVNDYQVGERIETVSCTALANSYTLENTSLLVLDSTGIYSSNTQRNRLLLTHSPKINLERLFEHTDPIEVIADGSNYTSYINYWRQTCLKYNIPFHYTGEKGAYTFPLKN